MAATIAARLDAIAEETERGWSGRVDRPTRDPGGFVFERTVRGVKEYAHLDMALINSADARALDRYARAARRSLRRLAGAEAQGRFGDDRRDRWRCSTRCSRPAARA